MKKNRNIFYSLLIAFLLVFGLSSCGGKSSGNSQSYTGGGEATEVTIDTQQKIIYTVNYSLYSDSFEEVIKLVGTELQKDNGYVLNSHQYDEYATYVYKVPSENLNTFLAYVDEAGTVSSKSMTTEDVTSQYDAYEAEIEILQARKQAYIAMTQKEGLSMSDLISLNDKIDEVEKEIQALEDKKAYLDSITNYSTVTINYYKSKQTESSLYWSNYFSYLITIGKTAGSVVLYSLPFACISGIVVGIVFLVRKKKQD